MIRSRTVAIESATAAAISLFLAMLVVGPVLPLLDSSWFSADMLAQYVTTETWSPGGFTPTTHYGYPFGLDYNYFPNGDLVENGLTHALSRLTGSTFAGVNLLILLSFPLAGALALVLVRLTGMCGPLAVAFAVAIAMLPFHWVRALQHTYLSTTISVLTGLILVLVVASGRMSSALTASSRRDRYWAILGVLLLVSATAWMGIYYAAFAVILGCAALLLRFAKRDRWRDLAIAAIPIVGILILVAVGQFALLLARGRGAQLAPIADRTPIESFHLAGALIAAVLPGPISISSGYSNWITSVFGDAPQLENTLASNFGTIVTTGALLLFLGTLLRRSRRGEAVSPPDPSGTTPGVVAWLLGATLLFFIPWGLNFAFAVFVTPQIRSWNRLLPVLLILFLVAAATVLRGMPWLRTERSAFLAACLVVLVTGLEVVVPMAGAFTSTVRTYSDKTGRARTYAADLNAAIPGACAILQMPLYSFPEPDAPFGGASGYDHLWQSLTNPEKSWSYGAMKNTTAALWQEMIVGNPTDRQVGLLEEAGFCGIHVDNSGYTSTEALNLRRDLTSRFGAPVAVDEADGWSAWRLPEPRPITPPSTWSPSVRELFVLSSDDSAGPGD